jgi:hypothetical protein
MTKAPEFGLLHDFHEQALRSIGLFASNVAPTVRSRLARH